MMYLKCISTILLASIAIVYLESCSKDDDNRTSSNENKRDAYYVRYEAHSNSGYKVNNTFSVTYTSDLGLQMYNRESVGYGNSWEGTYGPFRKGDGISLHIMCSSGDVNGRIYVSRNEEPFVVKAEGKNRGSITLEYIIDY